MEVHFTPEQEAQLARIATSAGIAAEEIVRHAALRLLEEEMCIRDSAKAYRGIDDQGHQATAVKDVVARRPAFRIGPQALS